MDLSLAWFNKFNTLFSLGRSRTLIPLIYHALIYIHVCERCKCIKKLMVKHEIKLLNNIFYLVVVDGDCRDRVIPL